MIVIRGARPERDFAIISNAVLRDDRLSFRARGVLCFILSFPDNFQVSSDRLAGAGKEGRDAIRSCFTELEGAGYLSREKRQNAKGLWETTVIVSDTACSDDVSRQPTPENPSSVELSPTPEKPTTGKPTTGKPEVGFPGVNKNTDKNKKKEEKAPRIDFDGSRFIHISDAQITVWANAYPAVDVLGEIRKAAAWLDANPANRKSDYKRFLNGWLTRAQDRAPRVQSGVVQMPRPVASGGKYAGYHAEMAAVRQKIYGTPTPDADFFGGQANVERDITGECQSL